MQDSPAGRWKTRPDLTGIYEEYIREREQVATVERTTRTAEHWGSDESISAQAEVRKVRGWQEKQ